ncbi:carbohydrate binding domain-containing protein [Candidatus Gracilibacteria bacterium]|nr:carbohydrate binding domain-containing protein [Candidatus Gracilibacteria bacterium]
MYILSRFKYLLLPLFFIGILFSSVALARESYFKPLLSDVDVATPGPERISVTEEGNVSVASYEGNQLLNFPVNIEGFVVVASPVVANIAGDGSDEIVVVARDAQNAYRLYALSSAGQVVGSVDIPGEVYYDPVVIRRGGAASDDVFVPAIDGTMYRIRMENNIVTRGVAFQVGFPAGIALDGAELVVNYPERASVDVYRETNGAWARRVSFVVTAPVLYPVAVNSANGVWYAILRDGRLGGMMRQNGQMAAGYPRNLSGTPVGPVLFADVRDDSVGNELTIPFGDGTYVVIRTDGTVLQTASEKQFHSMIWDAEDPVAHITYGQHSSSVSRMVSTNMHRFISYLSRIKMPSAPAGIPDIALAVNNTNLSTGGIYSLGAVNPGDVRDVTFSLQNTGVGPLQLAGNVAIEGADAAFFQVTAQPNALTAAGRNTQFTVRFTAPALPELGTKSVALRIASNDPDESPFSVLIRADVAVNLLQDGSMEAPDLVSWRNWGAPAIKEKSAAQFVSPAQSLHINTAPAGGGGAQQILIPNIQAGHRYRLSYRYMLRSGELRQLIGIRDSNSDFERKVFATTAVSNNWQSYVREFTVPPTYISDLRVAFIVRSGEIYIDDVFLQEIPVVNTLPTDGDMEVEGLGIWQNYGQPLLVEKTAAFVHAGLQSLHVISNANFGAQQVNIPLVPGQRYRFTVWYRTAGGTFLPRLSTDTSNYDFEYQQNYALEPLLGSTGGEWSQYERFFTAPANYASGLFRIVLVMSSADYGPPYRNLPQGEGWFDDVRIEPAPLE